MFVQHAEPTGAEPFSRLLCAVSVIMGYKVDVEPPSSWYCNYLMGFDLLPPPALSEATVLQHLHSSSMNPSVLPPGRAEDTKNAAPPTNRTFHLCSSRTNLFPVPLISLFPSFCFHVLTCRARVAVCFPVHLQIYKLH